MNKGLKLFYVICTTIMLFSIGGVFAFWEYATNTVNPTQTQQYLAMEEFYYQENVPGDGKNELSHNALLLKIVDEDEGINNPNSLLSKALEKRFKDGYDTVASNQQVSGGNLRNVFSSVDGFENVGFLIEYINAEEYYIYTYDNRDTVNLRVSIPTYLTHAHMREGKWVLSGGFEGTAITCVYDGKTNGPYKNTINPDTYIRNQN